MTLKNNPWWQRDLELVRYLKESLKDMDTLTEEEISNIIYSGFSEYEKRYCITIPRTLH